MPFPMVIRAIPRILWICKWGEMYTSGKLMTRLCFLLLEVVAERVIVWSPSCHELASSSWRLWLFCLSQRTLPLASTSVLVRSWDWVVQQSWTSRSSKLSPWCIEKLPSTWKKRERQVFKENPVFPHLSWRHTLTSTSSATISQQPGSFYETFSHMF